MSTLETVNIKDKLYYLKLIDNKYIIGNEDGQRIATYNDDLEHWIYFNYKNKKFEIIKAPSFRTIIRMIDEKLR